MEELEEMAGLCSGNNCTDDNNVYVLMKKWGYNEYGIISSDDIIKFLEDYNSDNLVNKSK
jgi:hypothetical protein